jgi:hypothetical protein
MTLEEQIRSFLGAAKQRLLDRRNTTSSPRELTDLVESTRADLEKSFPREAEPLLVAVESTMDTELRRLQAMSGRGGTIQLVRLPQSGSGDARVQSAIDRIVAAIDHILSYDKLAVTLRVTSQPPGADLVLQIQQNQHTLHTATTDYTIKNVWRGIYTVTARRPGYKEGTTRIDLITDSPKGVSCRLVRDAAADRSVCDAQQ